MIAEAELGEEARKFLESDLGRCLIGMAQQEVDLAKEALLSADPNDPKAVRDLQNVAWLGLRFQEWLAELISKGDNALNIWRQETNGSSN